MTERSMAGRARLTAGAVLVLAVLVFAAAALPSLAQPSGAQPPAAAAPAQGEKFLNVQTLKDLNPAQLHDAMVFMTAALGTNCEACHVRAANGQMAFEKDDKRNKGTTRKMIEMVNAINARDFNGEPQVNCMTCHQGRLGPNGTPQLAQPVPPGQAAAPAAAPPGPGGRPKPPTETVEQVASKFVEALGGRDALAGIASRTGRGTVTNRAGQTSPVTIDEKAPGFYLAQIGSTPASSRGVNASGAWTATGDRIRDLVGVEAWTLAAVSDLRLPLEMTKRYTGLQVRSYDTIDGRDVIVLSGRPSPDATETLSFDRTTGLLLRRVVRFRLAMGRLPMQIDYADYRAVGGVKMPFEVRVTDWAALSTTRLTDIVVNPALDDSRFARPQGKRP